MAIGSSQSNRYLEDSGRFDALEQGQKENLERMLNISAGGLAVWVPLTLVVVLTVILTVILFHKP